MTGQPAVSGTVYLRCTPRPAKEAPPAVDAIALTAEPPRGQHGRYLLPDPATGARRDLHQPYHDDGAAA